MEPVSGESVKIEERCAAGDYLYDSITDRQLMPILRWAGSSCGDEVLGAVKFASATRRKLLGVAFYIPLSLLAAGLFALALSRLPKKTPPRKRRARRVSLRTKLFTVQVLGFCSILTAFSVFQYSDIHSQMHAEIAKSGDSIAQGLLELLREHPEFFTSDALEPMLLRFATRLTNLAHATVIDQDRRIIADAHPFRVGSFTDQNSFLDLLQGSATASSTLQRDGHRYLRLSYAITGPYDLARRSTVMGALSLDLRLSNTDEEINAGFTEAMAILIALLLIFWGVQYLFTDRSLLRQLDHFTETAERFGNGTFSARAIIPTKDELGELAIVFNHMGAEIQRCDAALRHEIVERKQVEEQQAQLLKELESVNRELNDFAYVVSHDLKAPLRAIGSLTGWIVDDYADKLDDEGKGQLHLLLSRETYVCAHRRIMNSYKPILLVKDDRVDAMTIKRALKGLNITNRLAIAENGEEALA